ncbi:MAG: ATP-binding protein [Muribaculaceae bacterium]|nr:ATP-binding protein [Muribaculaceae bacterium]
MASNNKIIGRQREIELLNRYAQSGKPEFIAIYGRRRVGKTFLIQNVFRQRMTYATTGVIGGDATAQMHAFIDAMDIFGSPVEKMPHDWYEAFAVLRRFLTKRIVKGERCIVFIDELPCFDTMRSDFANALGYFWNSWAVQQPEMMLIVCGSSTSWMMKNIIDSHGGLHDRITHEMHLREFTLHDTELFLKSNGFLWDRLTILQAYMICGGVPYYLDMMAKEESLAQNIDRLFFDDGAEMKREFNRLYSTLFSSPEPYVAIVEALAKKQQGLTRAEVATALNIEPNGRLTAMLRNLLDCDIVRFYRTKEKKISTRGGIYQLTDMFSNFFMKFVKEATTDRNYWQNSLNTPVQNTWLGLAFERVCVKHVEQLKRALHIDTIRTEYYAWRGHDESSGERAQIDLVIERADRIANICEMKYSQREYALSKPEHERLQRRIDLFVRSTAYKGGVMPVIVTTNALAVNAYSEYIAAVVTLNDLFAP